jgi:thiol-disulfide isomerase/thioredoxin
MLIQNILSFNDFTNYIKKYKYIIINISSTWCKPCIELKPSLEKFIYVIDEHEYIYLKLDNSIYDEDPEFERYFNLVKFPYFAFIKNEIIIDSFISSDFTIVSKRLFENISVQKEEEKTIINNSLINSFNNVDDF